MSSLAKPNLAGANQDPLAELKPLQLPISIDSWPWAPGWYILIISVCLIIGVTTFLFIRYRRVNLYKRQALIALQNIEHDYQENNNISKSTEALSALLKQVILVHLPRTNISQLSGNKWLQLLDAATNSKDFSEGSGSLIGERAFQNLEQDPEAEKDLNKLFSISKNFIKNLNTKQFKQLKTPIGDSL